MALRKQMIKQKFGTTKELQPTAFQNRYNLNDECIWPIFIHGESIKDCNFKFEILNKNKQFDIVKLPKDTLLFHTTIQGVKKDKWWLKYHPRDTNKGGIFFNPSEDHQGLHTGDTILIYKTKCDVYMLFINNIYKKLGFAVGNDMVPNFKYKMLLKNAENKYKLKISGYIGCNECEIFIHNEDIEQCVYKNPIKEKAKFID